jgi:GTP-binding protein
LIVANKMDLPAAHQNADRLVKEFGKEKVFPISAITGEGIDNLIDRTYTLLQQIPAQAAFVGEEPVITRYKDEAPFFIENIDGVFQVTGKRIEKLVAMINLDNEEGLQRFQHIINRMGLEDALRAKGIKDGDTVRIKDVELIYSE